METSRYFEDLVEGEEFGSPSRTLAESDLYIFAGLTGDMTEFHLSSEAAKPTVFGQRPAHGMLLLGIANGLYNRIGVTDRTGMALSGIDWRFRAPAFIGDTVHLVVSVERKQDLGKPDRGLVFWDAKLLNQRGEILGDGHMVRFVMRRPAAASERP